MRIKESISHRPSVKGVVYTSKEEALKTMRNEVGEDLDKLLGDINPLPNNLLISFNEAFVTPDSLAAMKAEFEKDPGVLDVSYNQMLVENMDKIVRITGLVLLSIAAVMGLVSIGLIYNTIRLTLYARRFLIKSMQLVGATQNFIRMPFLKRGFVLGLISGLIACGMLYIGLILFVNSFPVLAVVQDTVQLLLLFAGIVFTGILISTLASYAAINKYLRMKLDDLF
jgi:cell division transport system permease protein